MCVLAVKKDRRGFFGGVYGVRRVRAMCFGPWWFAGCLRAGGLRDEDPSKRGLACGAFLQKGLGRDKTNV